MARIGFAAWKGGAVFVDPTEVVAVSAGKVGTTRIECRDGTRAAHSEDFLWILCKWLHV